MASVDVKDHVYLFNRLSPETGLYFSNTYNFFEVFSLHVRPEVTLKGRREDPRTNFIFTSTMGNCTNDAVDRLTLTEYLGDLSSVYLFQGLRGLISNDSFPRSNYRTVHSIAAD